MPKQKKSLRKKPVLNCKREELTVAEPVVLGIDIGGTNIRLGLVNESYKLEGFEIRPTESVFTKESDAVEKFGGLVKGYIEKNLNDRVLKAVSAGFPSTVSRDRRTVIQTPNIEAIPDDFLIVDALEEIFDFPIFINKDTNNLLFYDMKELGIEDCDSVCGIYFGTGVGNAVMIDGKILSGHNGVASELGHMPIYGNMKKCTCGNESCLETVVSGIALENLRNEFFPDIEIKDIFAQKGETKEIKTFVRGMAQAVATQENLFDPECIVLGGGLLMNGFFPFDEFEKDIHYFTRKPYPEKNMKIKYSRPAQINGVIGAAIYAFKRMKNQNYL